MHNPTSHSSHWYLVYLTDFSRFIVWEHTWHFLWAAVFELVGGTSDGKCLADKRSGESVDGLPAEIRFWLLYFDIIFFISWRGNSFNCKSLSFAFYINTKYWLKTSSHINDMEKELVPFDCFSMWVRFIRTTFVKMYI